MKLLSFIFLGLTLAVSVQADPGAIDASPDQVARLNSILDSEPTELQDGDEEMAGL